MEEIRIVSANEIEEMSLETALEKLEDAKQIISLHFSGLSPEKREFAELAHLRCHEAQKWIEKVV
jgi:hypothetical protein